MRKRLALTIYFFAVSMSSLAAQGNRILLDDLISEAKENNAQILAARNVWLAATKRAPQVSTLPDPTVMYVFRNVGLEDYTVGSEMMAATGFTATQKVPFFGKLGLMGEMAERDADRLEQIYLNTQLSVTSALRRAYYDYWFVQKSLETVREDQEILKQFEETARTKYAVGKGIQQDVLKAQVEISRLIQKTLVLGQRRESLRASINSLLNRPPGDTLALPADPALPSFNKSLADLEELSLSHSPKLAAQQAMIRKAEAAHRLAKRQYYPNFAVTAGWLSRGDLSDIFEARIGVELPLYFFRKQRNAVAELQLNVTAMEQMDQNVREQVLAAIKSAYVQATTARELMALYQEGIIPQASVSLESAIHGYEVGSVDFLTLLNNLVTLLNDELQFYEQQSLFLKGLAGLEALVGTMITE